MLYYSGMCWSCGCFFAYSTGKHRTFLCMKCKSRLERGCKGKPILHKTEQFLRMLYVPNK